MNGSWLVLLVLVCSTLGRAQNAALPSRADGGLDADLRHTVNKAREALAQGNPTQASELLLHSLSATDRFSEAQRGVLAESAAPLLTQTSSIHLAEGNVAFALRDIDAAWTLQARPRDPKYAALLISYAKSRPNPEALFLARRALAADPENAEAKILERQLSTNPFSGLGLSLVLGGVASLGTAIVSGLVAGSAATELKTSVHQRIDADLLVSRYQTFSVLSLASYIGAGVGYLLGELLLWAGHRNYGPVSPEILPALPEVRP